MKLYAPQMADSVLADSFRLRHLNGAVGQENRQLLNPKKKSVADIV
jgi:hypothetical protein